ncbi:MAG: glutathionylspermidine synthase family protein [Rhodocyclales bacterium]|nr:glutathionylspermidine synthase family protein [Rhodocyclales bacterium]
MERLASQPRADWEAKFERMGFSFHSLDGVYWNESACYRFSSEEIDTIESAAAELHRLCRSAVGFALANDLWDELRIPREHGEWIKASWQKGEPSLYGRFDLCYDGRNPPRLLEYNADTPTSLIEAAIAQWHWLREVRPNDDQFNSLHERLIERWRELARNLKQPMHFACVRDSEEDRVNLEYLADTALQAGIEARFLHLEDIGLDAQGRFVDAANRRIETLFKLYPWEWMLREPFAPALCAGRMAVVEPPWKAVLSNKALLPLLWELFPDHPNLLPAYFEPAPLGGRHVAKPIFSREGADIILHDGARTLRGKADGYGSEGYVYQALAPLPEFDGRYPVIGAWIVGDEPAGMGIREDATPITTNASHFLPHYFD